LLQIQRLADQAANIREKAPREPGEMLCVRAPEALFDFEALLFHSRSVLDIVTFFVCSQVYKQQCDRFSKIATVVSNFENKDSRVLRLREIVADASRELTGILIDTDCRRSLRSELIHRSTVGEMCIVGFALHCVEHNRRLAFDTVLSDHALLATAYSVCSNVVFVVLNTLSLYLDREVQLGVADSALNWPHGFVDYRNYATLQETPSKVFSIWKPMPSGFALIPVALSDEICNMTY